MSRFGIYAECPDCDWKGEPHGVDATVSSQVIEDLREHYRDEHGRDWDRRRVVNDLLRLADAPYRIPV